MARKPKWWQVAGAESLPSATAEDHVRRVAEVNAGRAIQIETVGGDHAGSPSGSDGKVPTVSRVDERFLNEEHHRQYGHPWALGKCIFEFVVEAGLRPEHRLLDFGCGAIRFGHWVIPYLDAGNYFGVDAHLSSLEAATTYEIPLHGLEGKRPRLLWNEEFAFSYFGTTFDWIVDFSSARRVKPEGRRARGYAALAQVLAPSGHLLTAPSPPRSVDLEGMGLTLVRSKVGRHCPLLEGHERFKSTQRWWWEFVRT